MRISYTYESPWLRISAEPEAADRDTAGNARLARPQAEFKLDKITSTDDIHPDIRALAALIAFYPWIGQNIHLDSPVSSDFASAVMQSCRIEVGPVSAEIIPRHSPSAGVPGLSFSAGVDSMAALALLPADAEAVFTLRTEPPSGKRSLYKPEVALHAADEMRARGRHVHIVEASHEWVRDPVGFSVDPAPGIPMLLLADSLNLDSVTFGTIAESAYLTGKGKWSDYANRIVYTRWRDLFGATGLAFNNVVAGVSEFGTSAIVQASEFGHLAQSCIRGSVGNPCFSCVKCFRKSLITASLTDNWPDLAHVSRMMAKPTIKAYLEKSPIRFELILTAAMNSYTGDNPLLQDLKTRVGGDVTDASFTRAWYPGSMNLISDKYRHGVIDSASQFLPRMNESQVDNFERYDIDNRMISDRHADQINQFSELLDWNSSRLTQRIMA